MRAIYVAPGVLTGVTRAAADEYPYEACGFLIGRTEGDVGWVDRAVRTTNVAPSDRARRYAIDPGEWRRMEVELVARGGTLLGIYHSHPDHPAAPSPFDQDHAWPGLAYLIVRVDAGRPGDLAAFELRADTRRFHEVPWGERSASGGVPPPNADGISTLALAPGARRAP